jgi:hypothetical protein
VCTGSYSISNNNTNNNTTTNNTNNNNNNTNETRVVGGQVRYNHLHTWIVPLYVSCVRVGYSSASETVM